MSFPFTDDELVEMAKKFGARDAKDSEGLDGLDERELYDVADDAWYHSGWMEFENHPSLDGHEDVMSAKSSELKLSTAYADEFVAAVAS